MNHFDPHIKKLSLWSAVGLLCLSIALMPVPGRAGDSKPMSAIEMAEKAVVDTLYYNYEPWFERFARRIRELEARPATTRMQLELMKLYFYSAALNAELTHALSFTEDYQIERIRRAFQSNSQKTIDIAHTLLDKPDLPRTDRADAYFFLGVAEGYVALLEYGEGHILSALIDGLRADNHLEDALVLAPHHADAHVGLGVYRYGNTRLGGFGNFLLQGGQDLRLTGLKHIESALKSEILSRPLALKTLIWFYISEQINPANAGLADNETLSPKTSRRRAQTLMDEYERRYFTDVPQEGFIGNKGFAMMRAIQAVLDGEYAEAKNQFRNALEISHYLTATKGFKINPKYIDTVQAGIEFCELMLLENQVNLAQKPNPLCTGVTRQIRFIEKGGSMVEYQSSKIRGEIQDVFYNRLKGMSQKHDC
ncbi:hypothetical protein [Nitrospina watsonii]|uniref:Uncharacterized protein n=1 Tax=Nitrospina watsonii TaxID=1323948 RepID=A0ABM9HBD7_9BACT|nr:hypothetical protein [Nitrospina watsonii]CAI2717458.1 conserved protein of unknown function [Nitrospina watsonii]